MIAIFNSEFSVSMCVYYGDNPEWFNAALNSVIEQTLKPSEIVIVVDGPVPDSVQDVLELYSDICIKNSIELKIIRLAENKGHGIARRESIDNCSYDIIALMDADDISVPTRFEQEIQFLVQARADIVGGDIAEFIDNPDNIVGYRRVPMDDGDIKKYMKKRCPFNQMTVMFKRQMYVKAGGYLDWLYNEDYYLWIRMMLKNAKFANMGKVLVNVRVGNEMYQRRGGIKYFKSELGIQNLMLKNSLIGVPRYIINVLQRLIIQVLVPNRLRGFLFRTFARD